jgi:iron complex outermembrane recepter protein
LAACCVSESDPDGDGICDHSGDDLPFAPELSASASATFDVPVLDGLELFGGASVSYSDSYLTDGTLDPAAAQGSHSKIDANIGLRNV